jgi:hypothetical protein
MSFPENKTLIKRKKERKQERKKINLPTPSSHLQRQPPSSLTTHLFSCEGLGVSFFLPSTQSIGFCRMDVATDGKKNHKEAATMEFTKPPTYLALGMQAEEERNNSSSSCNNNNNNNNNRSFVVHHQESQCSDSKSFFFSSLLLLLLLLDFSLVVVVVTHRLRGGASKEGRKEGRKRWVKQGHKQEASKQANENNNNNRTNKDVVD